MQHRAFQKHAVHTAYALIVAAMVSGSFGAATRADQAVADDGIVRSKSAYAFADTVDRLTKDVASKGIMLFSVIDQTKLAKDAGLNIIPSTLLVFGNPALGTQFVAAQPEAGLDWPVRLLVQQDRDGHVWVSYTDFAWIARRHKVRDGEIAFTTASGVIASITASVAAK